MKKFSRNTIRGLGILTFWVSLHTASAQAPNKRAEGNFDDLKSVGNEIAKAVIRRDWSAVLSYERPTDRAEHERLLKDKTSELYCFLVDSKCNPSWPLQSIYERFSRSVKLKITTSDLGISRSDGHHYAALAFYDGAVMSEQSIRSPKFVCIPENFHKIAWWTFKEVGGMWVSASWLFQYASDFPCNP